MGKIKYRICLNPYTQTQTLGVLIINYKLI